MKNIRKESTAKHSKQNSQPRTGSRLKQSGQPRTGGRLKQNSQPRTGSRLKQSGQPRKCIRSKQSGRKKSVNRNTRQRKSTRQHNAREYTVRRQKMAMAFILTVLVIATALFFIRQGQNRKKDGHGGGQELSAEVLQYEALVDQYTAEYGITKYKDYILAIIQTESAGLGDDIMQSSESLGLEPGSLGAEESVKQGCYYFAKLLEYAGKLGCDVESAVQAYNYGMGYLDFVAAHGKTHSYELAEEFALEMSGGETVAFEDPIALERNGGWRYKYGNMFYVELVKRYLSAG